MRICNPEKDQDRVAYVDRGQHRDDRTTLVWIDWERLVERIKER